MSVEQMYGPVGVFAGAGPHAGGDSSSDEEEGDEGKEEDEEKSTTSKTGLYTGIVADMSNTSEILPYDDVDEDLSNYNKRDLPYGEVDKDLEKAKERFSSKKPVEKTKPKPVKPKKSLAKKTDISQQKHKKKKTERTTTTSTTTNASVSIPVDKRETGSTRVARVIKSTDSTKNLTQDDVKAIERVESLHKKGLVTAAPSSPPVKDHRLDIPSENDAVKNRDIRQDVFEEGETGESESLLTKEDISNEIKKELTKTEKERALAWNYIASNGVMFLVYLFQFIPMLVLTSIRQGDVYGTTSINLNTSIQWKNTWAVAVCALPGMLGVGVVTRGILFVRHLKAWHRETVTTTTGTKEGSTTATSSWFSEKNFSVLEFGRVGVRGLHWVWLEYAVATASFSFAVFIGADYGDLVGIFLSFVIIVYSSGMAYYSGIEEMRTSFLYESSKILRRQMNRKIILTCALKLFFWMVVVMMILVSKPRDRYYVTSMTYITTWCFYYIFCVVTTGKDTSLWMYIWRSWFFCSMVSSAAWVWYATSFKA